MSARTAAQLEKQIPLTTKQVLSRVQSGAVGKNEDTAALSRALPQTLQKPGLISNVLGRVSGIANFTQLPFIPLFFLSYLKLSDSKIGFLKSIGTFAERSLTAKANALGNPLSKPIAKVAGWTGSQALASASGNVAKGEKIVFRQTENLFTHMGSAAERAIEAVGLNGWRMRRVNSGMKKAGDAYQAALGSLAEARGALSSEHMNTAHAALAQIEADIKAAGAKGMAPERLSTLMQGVDDKIEAALKNAKLEGAAEKALTASVTSARKHMGSFVQKAANAYGHHNTAEFVRDISQGLKHVPGRVANMNLSMLSSKFLYGSSQAYMAWNTVERFDASTYKRMYEASTGQKAGPFFFMKVMTGNLPDTMKGMAKDYWVSALPQAAANIASMALFRYFHRSSGGNLMSNGLGVAAQMAVSGAGNFFASQNSRAMVFNKLQEAEAHGMEMPTGAYLGFLLNMTSGANRNNPAIEQVAAQYATEHTPIATVLHELHTGAFNTRLMALKTAKPANENKSVEVANDVSSQKAGPVTIGSMTITPKPIAKPVAASAGTHAERIAFKNPANDTGVASIAQPVR